MGALMSDDLASLRSAIKNLSQGNSPREGAMKALYDRLYEDMLAVIQGFDETAGDYYAEKLASMCAEIAEEYVRSETHTESSVNPSSDYGI
jgi:hypothetical protein